MTQSEPQVLVVGMDYSELGELALARALRIASSAERAELHIVHVVEHLAADTAADHLAALVDMGAALERLARHVEERVDSFQSGVEHARRGGLARERVFSHVRFAEAAFEVAQLAADLEADLVIVGTHGRVGAARLLFGSVAEHVVRLSPCPVLVVRPKNCFGTPAPRIEAPCPYCVEARRESGGAELWCTQHRAAEKHRHTYNLGSREIAEPELFAGRA